MKSVINKYELSLYYVIWCTIVPYALYKNVQEQNNILQKYSELEFYLRDLAPGWDYLSRSKDVSDVEWTTWKYFIQTSWFYFIFQFIVSELIRNTKPSIIKHWYILSSVIYLTLFMGVKHLVVFLLQPLLFALIIFMGGKKTIIWVFGTLILYGYNYIKNISFVWTFLYNGTDAYEEVYLLFFGTAWNIIRCISFCVDFVDTQEKEKDEKETKPYSIVETSINMFSYVLYTPLLFTGPVMLYEEFEASFKVTDAKIFPRLKKFCIDMVLYLIYTFIMDVALHYFYFYALQERLEIVKEMSSLAICGGGIWMGFQFHLKYVIAYGTTAAVARLDNMQPPPTPRCIARIHVYSHMWRYFDVGLYNFLVKYIYRPGYTKLSQYRFMSKTLYKVIASFFTFTFIFIWHGITWHIFVWAALNYICILLEYTGKTISRTDSYERFKKNVLRTEANALRFEASVCSVLLLVSIISNFYLFGGANVGDMFIWLLYWPKWSSLLLVLIAAYSCCHVSMSLANVTSRTDVKRKIQ